MAVALIVFAVMLRAASLCKGQIVFLQEPKNVTVSEGADAFFACTYHGTTGVPVWRIANNVFTASALPPRHLYNGSGLVISNADLSLNMNSYSCFFSIHIGGGQFMDIESTTGFLVIAASASSTSTHLKPSQSSAWRYTEPTIHYHATTVFVELTIAVSVLEQSIHTLGGKMQPVATDFALPLTPVQLNLPIVIGIVAGVGISLLITTTLITVTCICVVRQKRQTLKITGKEVPSKTQEQVDIKMKENLAYEIPPSRIKMTENQAYSTLPIVNRS